MHDYYIQKEVVVPLYSQITVSLKSRIQRKMTQTVGFLCFLVETVPCSTIRVYKCQVPVQGTQVQPD